MYQRIITYLNEQGPMSLPIVWGSLLGLLILAILTYYAYAYGSKIAQRRMRRLVKRNENRAERFIMQQAEDGAMEIRLSKKAYKELRQGPLEGNIIGSKNQMVLRIKVL